MNTNLPELMSTAKEAGYSNALLHAEALCKIKFPGSTKDALEEMADFVITKAYDSNRTLQAIVDLLLID